MTAPEDLADWVRLMQTPGVGPLTARQLLSAFGPPRQVFQASHAALARVVSSTVAAALLNEPDGPTRDLIDRTLHWAAQPGQTCLTLDDPAYPQSLLDTIDPPPLLYALGDATLLNAPRRLAMVGARTPTAQGERDAQAFARAFSEAGVTIVSGFALGIDAAAHRGALEATGELAGSTIAVLGTGCDRVYPPRHKELAHLVAERGLLLSEFALGTSPTKGNFPRRNRLISGLSRGVLVVEAATHSGSLITARLAGEQGREVFAMPGSIHNPLAHGCHRLIREGAKLVETAQDVLEEFGWDSPLPTLPTTPQATNDIDASDDDPPERDTECDILRALGYEIRDFDDLSARTGWPPDRLAARLLDLELQGRIARLPGGRFQRIAHA
ncbi:DNA-processing protein DprA [Thiomonas bhubaneswarensis]|uniref:DNA protecting protein DprA n=1 Tax=Thiomonas bhubaneswarensis TaxID=339866 RepID=A0A0K6HSU3_9BURK|nr:DNA-processing protein DprA [Thiomonas bhubaneswarensis]CUA93969.1 DNA protecting protein DprA [Thiomonas bhubaneswarensis]